MALERPFVFNTSAHLPFPPTVIRRCQLAAIEMTMLWAENKVRRGHADPHVGEVGEHEHRGQEADGRCEGAARHAARSLAWVG